MGAVSCTKVQRREEESAIEADITLAYHNNMHRKSRTLYQTLATRVSLAKDELISSIYKEPLSCIKNYDSYYGFLSNHVISAPIPPSHCSTSGNSEETFSQGPRPSKPFIPIPIPHNPKTRSTTKGKLQPRPKSKIKSRAVMLKIAIESPSKISTVFPPTSHPHTRKELTVNTRQSASNLKLPLERKRRMSTCIVKNEHKTQLDIISLLPENILSLICSFIVDQYPSSLLVCVSWYASLLSSLDYTFNPIEAKLAQTYVGQVLFHNSYNTFTKQCKKVNRIDRVIQLELLGNTAGKTLTLGYTYKYINEPHSTYMTKYKIDCKGKTKRTVWIYKSKQGNDAGISANTVSICAGDLFEISINYYTLRGLIDVSTIKWIDPVLEATPTVKLIEGGKERDSLSPEELKLVKESMERVCELEQISGGEWYDSRYYHTGETESVDLTGLEQFFEIVSVEHSPVDPKNRKVILKAFRPGLIQKKLLGIETLIKRENEMCVNEVKRVGLIIDRGGEIQIRVGDTLILYLSEQKFE